jgi:hypothetical protein
MSPCRCALLSLVTLTMLASAGQAQTTLRYRFKEGEKFNYVLDFRAKVHMNLLGKEAESKKNLMLELAWNVVKVDAKGNAQVQIKVTHAHMTMEGSMGLVIEADSKKKPASDDPAAKPYYQTVKAYASTEVNATLSPTGEMKDIKIADETLKVLKGLPVADKLGEVFSTDNFRILIGNVVLPAAAVMKGKTWSNKIEARIPFGKMITENVYTYEGPVDKDGMKLQKIATRPSIKLEADPNADYEIKLKNVKASGFVYFDNNLGRIAEVTSQQHMEQQISFMGLMQNQTADTTLTLKLKK